MKINRKDLFVIFIIFLFVFSCQIVNANTNINLLEECSVLSGNFGKKLKLYFALIKIAVPILTVLLIGKDMITAIASGNSDNMKKAQSTSIKRLIIGIIIFLLPIILEAILGIVKLNDGSCSISQITTK